MDINLDQDGVDLTITRNGNELVASLRCEQDGSFCRHDVLLSGQDEADVMKAALDFGVDLSEEGILFHLSRANGQTESSVIHSAPFKLSVTEKTKVPDVSTLQAALEGPLVGPVRNSVAQKIADVGISDVAIVGVVGISPSPPIKVQP